MVQSDDSHGSHCLPYTLPAPRNACQGHLSICSEAGRKERCAGARCRQHGKVLELIPPPAAGRGQQGIAPTKTMGLMQEMSGAGLQGLS